jgi:imidazoleglycerol-phosphate dehydratase
MTANRSSVIERKTSETDIVLKLNVDGCGQHQIDTGIGFLDHMLELFAVHGRFDLEVVCRGDVRVDAHHSTEDLGICLGQAFAEALGEKRGITRYGQMILPMEETLVTVAIDLSGRSYVVFQAKMPSEKIGEFDSELVEDFWIAFSNNARCNYHANLHYGRNTHHIAEAIFKASARALRQACLLDAKNAEIPSTKGRL